MGDTPKISFIIPSYNSDRYIAPLLKELLRVEFAEIIVVDDGSTDETVQVVQKISKSIKLFSQPHKGVSASRNFGIEQAKGEYISFVDSDDIFSADRFNANLAGVSKSDLTADVIVFSPKVGKSVDVTKKFNLVETQAGILKIRNELPQELNINPEPFSKLYARKFVDMKNIRFKDYLSLGEDMIFNIQVANQANKIVMAFGDYYSYTPSESSVTQQLNFDVIKNSKSFLSVLKDNVYSELFLEKVADSFVKDAIKLLSKGTKLTTVSEFQRYLTSTYGYSTLRLSRKKKIFMWMFRNRMGWMLRLLLKGRKALGV